MSKSVEEIIGSLRVELELEKIATIDGFILVPVEDVEALVKYFDDIDNFHGNLL